MRSSMNLRIFRPLVVLSLCAIFSAAARAEKPASAQKFFENLRKLCGATFEGASRRRLDDAGYLREGNLRSRTLYFFLVRANFI